MAKKITLRDIAKEAEVSLSTVSQVLNNKPSVSADMRQHVLGIASKMGYRQKVETTSVLTSRLSTIGLVTKSHQDDQMLVNPFYSYVIAGVERECQRHNINLMYANIEVDVRNHATNFPSMLLDDMVDGVIVVGAFLEKTISDISRLTNQNMVLVDAYASDEVAFDSVLIDNFNGAFNAVTYLIENGHRHIGLIGSQEDAYPSILERRRGYKAALKQVGITERYIEDGQLLRPDAYEATLRLLERAPHLTAIFACNDNVAIGVMNAARELGLSIPDDLSVIGFDDIDVAQEVTPALTTMQVDKVYMGTIAMRQLRDRASDPERPAIKTLMNTTLIVRESVRVLRVAEGE